MKQISILILLIFTLGTVFASNIAYVNMSKVYEYQRVNTPSTIDEENKQLIQVIHKYIENVKPFVDMRKKQIKELNIRMNSIHDKQSLIYKELIVEKNRYQSDINFVNKQFSDEEEKAAPDLSKYKQSNLNNIDKVSKEIISAGKYDAIMDTKYLVRYSPKKDITQEFISKLKDLRKEEQI
ncbi:OmpH family outer membrane protein [Francisella sp. SYW-9]|uniref:OmpH family outer membrane protein n=1 Tax=Francisella sp. SYW-9 TaxID=2610888 RepID=UPI00123CA834|nr:OmpH family outer membrane protein [Francisella sp. SYW-9]